MLVTHVRLPRWVFPAAVLAFTLLPLAELALLVWLGGHVGVVPTLLLCAVTGFVGAWLARWQGFAVVQGAQRALAEGRFPADEIGHGALLLVGGVVLLTPGLITDLIGFLLLVPPTRTLLLAALSRAWRRAQAASVDRMRHEFTASGTDPWTGAGRSRAPEDDVVEGEVVSSEGDDR